MIIATFRPRTAAAGRPVKYEAGAFVAPDDHPLTAAYLFQYGSSGQIDWAYEGLEAWVAEMARLDAEEGARAPGQVSPPAPRPEPPEPPTDPRQSDPAEAVVAPAPTAPSGAVGLANWNLGAALGRLQRRAGKPGQSTSTMQDVTGAEMSGCFVISDGEFAILETGRLEAMIEIAKAIETQAGRQSQAQLISELADFEERLSWAHDALGKHAAVRLDVSPRERQVLDFLRDQVAIRSLKPGIAYHCRTCQKQWTANPSYVAHMHKVELGQTAVQVATAAVGVAFNPVSSAMTIFNVGARRDSMKLRCPSCKYEDIEQSPFVYCPVCGAPCSGAVIKACPHCKANLVEKVDTESVYAWRTTDAVRVPGPTGQKTAKIATGSPTRAMAFLSDGTHLLVGTADGTLELLDVAGAEGKQAQASVCWSVPRADGKAVVDVSPDGGTAAVAARSLVRRDSESVQLLRTTDGAQYGAIRADSAGMRGIAFSPDGSTMALACSGHMEFWETSGAKRSDQPLGLTVLDGLGWTWDGHGVVTANGKSVAVRTVDGDANLGRFEMPAQVTDISLGHDAPLLAVACGDGTASVFDLTSGEEVAHITSGKPFTAVALDHHGGLAIATGDGIELWKLPQIDADRTAASSGESVAT